MADWVSSVKYMAVSEVFLIKKFRDWPARYSTIFVFNFKCKCCTIPCTVVC